jgi:hypothetical protein
MEGMIMDRKYFQIKTDPNAHRQMKVRAGQLNQTIGRYLENLVSSMELRLKWAYKIAGAENLVGMLDDRFIKALLNADKNGLSEQKLKNELTQIMIDAREENLVYQAQINI